jgi:UDP-glucuronate decarboxylase
MRILVTGAAGFIGTNLCLRLLEEGFAVHGVDNLQTCDKRNIDVLENHPKFNITYRDVSDFYCTDGIDYIINLACPASPPKYQKDEVSTLMTNVYGTYKMLKIAEEMKIPLLQASTSEVYGNPMVNPQREDYTGNVNPIGVRACYDEGKRCAETLCAAFRRQRNVDTKIIRIFNTYGPYMNPDDGRVVSNFINQALRGEPLTVYGSGCQTRSFQYIDDLVEGIIKMMVSDYSVGGPINLGNPKEVSIMPIAVMIRDMINPDLNIVVKPSPKDDPFRRKPDITRAKDVLGWEPKVGLEEGLTKTIDYFKTL